MAWGRAMDRSAASRLSPRGGCSYSPPSVPQVLNTAGVDRPELCKDCLLKFETTIFTRSDGVYGLHGLSAATASSSSFGIAAAIRRAAFEAGSKSCCDACACEVGIWADKVSYLVLIDLMNSEQEVMGADWFLQCYLVWTVTLSPISVASILSGFDPTQN
jgi:hypothetical protein